MRENYTAVSVHKLPEPGSKLTAFVSCETDCDPKVFDVARSELVRETPSSRATTARSDKLSVRIVPREGFRSRVAKPASSPSGTAARSQRAPGLACRA